MAPRVYSSRMPAYKAKRSYKKKAYKKPLNYRTGGFERLESKFVDYNFEQLDVSDDWNDAASDPATALTLTACAQGDGESNRNGRKCTFTSIEVHAKLRLAPLRAQTQSPSSNRNIRVVMYQDTQTNQAQQGGGVNVFDVSASSQILSFRNLKHNKRFKILYDKTHRLEYSSGAGISASSDWVGDHKDIVIKKKLNMPVLFQSTTAVIGSITDNSIHMLAITDAPGNQVAFAYTSRARFTG